ncbi:VOC family protein [Amycolatopsis minnesotensis]|uniref:VOC family protein n=1 Tax=Amycolatopsis minnesotensis TaxID=337894 RepID=A0ABN2QK28_9PSEU
MGIELDHLVYATPDLDATVAELRAGGVPLSPGGPHVGVGTRNFLGGLGEGAYLEVVGPDPDQDDPRAPRPFGIDALTGPRLVTWAARTTDLDRAIADAAEAGHDAGAAGEMSRERPDGVLLRWRLAFPPDNAGGVLPFLIDWGASAHPSETAATGAVLGSFALAHPDPRRIATVLRALGADVPVEQGAPGVTAVLGLPGGGRLELGE